MTFTACALSNSSDGEQRRDIPVACTHNNRVVGNSACWNEFPALSVGTSCIWSTNGNRLAVESVGMEFPEHSTANRFPFGDWMLDASVVPSPRLKARRITLATAIAQPALVRSQASFIYPYLIIAYYL